MQNKKYWNCYVQKGSVWELQMIVGVVLSKKERPGQTGGLGRYELPTRVINIITIVTLMMTMAIMALECL